RLENDHRRRRLGVLAADLERVGGVRIDDFAETPVHVPDRRQAVGAGAAAAGEAKCGYPCALGLGQREDPARLDLGEELARSPRVAAERVEEEALEIRCLGDVHRRTRGLLRLGGRASTVSTGAEELVENVVLV